MATDYGEKERAFIDGLKEISGRELDEWMAAITEQNLPHRNDIIDWLRQQGFMFSKASWLERIHHNGGRPIYADTAAAPPAAPRQRQDASEIVKPPSAPKPEPVPVASTSVEARPDNDLDALLAKAKAYRPLAHFLIEQIKTVRPAARFEPRGTFIAIGDTENFAALGIGAKQLRLHLALGDHPSDEIVKKGVPGGGLGKADALSHMVVLTDARQVDAYLLDLIKRAAKKVND
jgi:predicted transport protein